MEDIKIINLMDMVYINIKMVINLKELGKMIKQMDMEFCFIKMDIF